MTRDGDAKRTDETDPKTKTQTKNPSGRNFNGGGWRTRRRRGEEETKMTEEDTGDR
jgi:hypothetical protein